MARGEEVSNIKFIELFAGIGGFRYGLERCNVLEYAHISEKSKQEECTQRGIRSIDDKQIQLLLRNKPSFNCVWANEIDKYAAQIYRRNYVKEIRQVQPLLEQPQNSRESQGNRSRPKSNNREWDERSKLYEGDITKVNTDDIPDFDLLTGGFPCQSFSIAGKRRGFNDTRGTMFFEIERICRAKKPRLILLENVKGLLSHDSGQTFQTILKILSDIGYVLQWQVLNSKNFGVPQNRERVFIIGHLRGTSRPKVFPIGRSNGKDIKAADEENFTADYRGDEGLRIREDGITPTMKKRAESRDHYNSILTFKKDMKIRRLTPTECERLQGFPDGWTEGASDTQRYKALGNAVTTNVITEIGRKLKNA